MRGEKGEMKKDSKTYKGLSLLLKEFSKELRKAWEGKR